LTVGVAVLSVAASAPGLREPLPKLPKAVEWARRYLAVDTTNPPGNETAAARVLEALLRADGVPCEVIETAPGRGNLVARVRGGGAPPLLLNHHIDVVEAVPAGWTRPPFSGSVFRDYLWGRGAVDNKGPGIAQAVALSRLVSRKVALDRDVVLLATADEERGGHLGVEALLRMRPDLVRGAWGVLGEGGANDVVVDRVALWRIAVAEKRPLWLRVEARGDGGHGAVPAADAPSHRLLRGLAALLDFRAAPEVSPLLQQVSREQAAGKLGRKREILADLALAVSRDVAEVEAVFGPPLMSLTAPTIGIGRFGGSAATNVLPPVAWAEVDLRIRPEDDAEGILRRVREIVAPWKLAISVIESAPKLPPSPQDHPLYRSLAAFLRRDAPGSVVAAAIQPGFSDLRHFRAAGVPSYGFAPVKVNYYDAAGIHGIDERIRPAFLEEGAERMYRFLVEACGAAPGRTRR
jgi:acetylornithine deacetylase/succinyl-diaminopimelate desuccinylase-like protein